MKIDDYIFTQSTLNKALHSSPSSRLDFALFAAIFSEQLDSTREHIESEPAFLDADFLQGIQADTQTGYHLMVEKVDYQTAETLNRAVCNQHLAHFKLTMCANTHPLSMYNDVCHIDEAVLANCSFATQKAYKEKASNEYFDGEHSIIQQQPSMLFDIIEQTHEQFQNL